MEGSNSSDTPLTKRELFTALHRQVRQLLAPEIMDNGPGIKPFPADAVARLAYLHQQLGRCPLFLAEQAWLSNSRIFAQRALRQKPDTWLKRVWLRDLENWQDYLHSEGYGADSHPQPEPPSLRPPTTLAPEVRALLKFGVKPWF